MRNAHATSTNYSLQHTYSISKKSYIRCIQIHSLVIMSNGNIHVDVVANHGEDLRFPISSSSGFSSPFFLWLTRSFRCAGTSKRKGPLQKAAGIFFSGLPKQQKLLKS
jgi:hypothetical protein